jgi:hypothetical protein
LSVYKPAGRFARVKETPKDRYQWKACAHAHLFFGNLNKSLIFYRKGS